jgi:transmembrane sensor
MDNNLPAGTGVRPGLEQIEQAAAAWLLKRESPQWSPADEAELNEWLQASTSHRVSFLRLRSVWQEADRLKVVGSAFPPGELPPQGAIAASPFFAMKRRAEPGRLERADGRKPGGRSARSARIKFYGFAASVLLTLALVGAIALRMWPATGASYSTAVGGLASVPMADGSKITLNTDSEVQLEISAHERRVKLVRGEAFFEVAKDPARPFVVHAEDKRVIAVGTRFAVRLKRDALQVAVTEGRVRVEQAAIVGRAEPIANLIAGNVAIAQRRVVRIQERPVADVEQSLGWRTGYVVLSKTLLADAVAEFNRYNRRQLVIEDPALAAIQVGGNFKSDNIDGFVRLLQEGFHIRAEERDQRIVLTGER